MSVVPCTYLAYCKRLTAFEDYCVLLLKPVPHVYYFFKPIFLYFIH